MITSIEQVLAKLPAHARNIIGGLVNYINYNESSDNQIRIEMPGSFLQVLANDEAIEFYALVKDKSIIKDIKIEDIFQEISLEESDTPIRVSVRTSYILYLI